MLCMLGNPKFLENALIAKKKVFGWMHSIVYKHILKYVICAGPKHHCSKAMRA